MSRLLASIAFVAAALVAVAGAAPAVAQGLNTNNVNVAVNGVPSLPGTYSSANVFQATCNGTENMASAASGSSLLRLTWQPQSNDTVFWDTDANCLTGNTVTNDAGGVISGNGTTGPITALQLGSAGATAYGIGAGNVTIDLRQVLASAFPIIYSGTFFDGGSPCSPPEQGTLYVCVTQTQINGSSYSYGFPGGGQATLSWYMAVTYDTNPPGAPGGLVGQSGDSNVTVSWSFSDNSFPNTAVSYNVYYQADPSLVANADGTCSGTAAFSKQAFLHDRHTVADGGDAGCSPGNLSAAGSCCTQDAGVDDGGNCLLPQVPVDAGPGDSTPGVCGGCAFDSDCDQTVPSICLKDVLGNTFCGPGCSPDGGFNPNSGLRFPNGGNLGCPQGFVCQPMTSVGGQSGTVCVPSDSACRPSETKCGFCTATGTQCGHGLCLTSDAGPMYCAGACDAGVNADGDGGCLGDTVCQSEPNGSFLATVCAPASQRCYDPTPLAVLLDGGNSVGVLDAGVLDAGLAPGSIVPPPWLLMSFPGTVSIGQIDGLQNGTCYDFAVQVVLSDGTLGVVSSQVSAAPVENFDFWRLYQGNGGADRGGLHCQSAGGAIAILAVATALLGLRRRRSAPGGNAE